MALVAFYLAQACLCDDAARVSTDAKIIQALRDEAARFRALAIDHTAKRDPYALHTRESGNVNEEERADPEEGQTSRKADPVALKANAKAAKKVVREASWPIRRT